MAFGWTNPFGKFGSGSGGAILPPSQSDILQWGIGTDDGLIVNDKKSPLVVDPEAAYVNRPVVAFNGTNELADSGTIPTSNSRIIIRMRRRNLSASGLGLINGLSNRMYLYLSGGFFAASDKDSVIATTLAADTEWHTHDYDIKNGTYSIDGTTYLTGLDFSGFTAGVYTFWLGARNGTSLNYVNCEIGWVECYENGVLMKNLPFEETEGTVLYDVSGNDNDVAITTSGIATMRAARADGISSWCALNGFRLSGSLQIPALADGTAAADGNPITNLGGYISNGADVDIVQIDADEAILGGASFFGDGVTWDEKTRAQWLAFVSGNDGLWLQWFDSDHLKEWVQYDVTRGYTEAEALQLIRWCNRYTSSGGGGVVAVLRYVNGDASLDGNDKVILVQP